MVAVLFLMMNDGYEDYDASPVPTDHPLVEMQRTSVMMIVAMMVDVALVVDVVVLLLMMMIMVIIASP